MCNREIDYVGWVHSTEQKQARVCVRNAGWTKTSIVQSFIVWGHWNQIFASVNMLAN